MERHQNKLETVNLDGVLGGQFWREIAYLDRLYEKIQEEIASSIEARMNALHEIFRTAPVIDPAEILDKTLSDPLPRELMTFTIVEPKEP